MVERIYEITQKKYFFCWVIGLLAVSKIFFIGKGAFAFPDELSYLEGFHIWNGVVDFDIKAICRHIIGAQLNTGHNLARLPSVVLQLLLLKYFDVPIMSPYSLIIPQIQNVIVHILQLILLFKILKIIDIKQNISIVVTILYSLAVNSNLYIRHTNSYDYSLLFFLLGTYLIIKYWNNITFKKGVKIGVIAAFGFTIYYGYYLFPIIIFLALVYNQKSYFSVFGYVIGAFSVFIFFEVIAQIGGVSFFAGNMLAVEGKYIGGDYNEGFIFLAKYVLDNENLIGIAVLLSFLFVIFKLFKKVLARKKLQVIEVLIFFAFLTYLMHASISFIFENKLFYGRTLKMFYPFLFIALALIFNNSLKSKTSPIVLFILLVISIISHIFFLIKYIPLGYPRDVLAHHKININTISSERIINESPPYFVYGSSPVFNKTFCFKKADNIKLVNFSYIHFNLDKYSIYPPAESEKKLYEALHFQSFLPYTYEEKKPEERDLMKKRAYKIKILRVNKME